MIYLPTMFIQFQRQPEEHSNGQAMGAPLGGGSEREITLKPKAIKAHSVLENTMLSYPSMSIYKKYTSPKNPIGVTPFQPTGEQHPAILRLGIQY